jgi:aminoglycoside 6'-N-acetyltransferase I
MGNVIEIRQLIAGDHASLARVAEDVFDFPVREDLTRKYLANESNVLVVALDDDLVVGMCSGMFQVHPDKEEELWINELGVSPEYQRQGIATRLLKAFEKIAHDRGCRGIWVLTEPTNLPANALYSSMAGWNEPETSVLYSVEFEPSLER